MLKIELDHEQKEAALVKDGYFLCLAGAGTGKTRVLAERTVLLIETGIPEDSILDLTYTRKAKNEMESRISTFLERKTSVHISTFHSFCFSFISMFRQNHKQIQIMDEEDRKSIIKQIIKQLKYEDLNADEVSAFIGRVKNKMAYKTYGFTRNQWFKMIKIYYQYQQFCLDNNRLDFDQMAYEFLEFLKKYPSASESISSAYQYIMVDECQDMNRVQYEIITIISSYHKNLFLVGDQDQTIYEWRGSDPRLINEFIDKYQPKILPLLNNYRCDGYVVEASNSLIAYNTLRIPKVLQAMKEKKNPIEVYSFNTIGEEAFFIARLIKDAIQTKFKASEIKVLFRQNIQASQLEAAFRVLGIKYEVNNVSLIQVKIVKNLIRYLRFIATLDDASILEVINFPARGIGEAKVNEILRFAADNRVSRFEACKLIQNDQVKAFVDLTLNLRTTMTLLQPSEFIHYLMDKIKYDKVISKEIKEKVSQLRVDAFCDAVANYQLKSDNYILETLNMMNELFLDNQKAPEDDEVIKLMTIHQAKGLEGKLIILTGFADKTIPGNVHTQNEMEAERRLAYVGITRMMEKLVITYPKSFMGKESNISCFIKEMGMKQTKK